MARFPWACPWEYVKIGEYIRNRRLTLAAHDLMISDETVLAIALKYRYESPDSFSKAFYRLHNVHPSEVRRDKKTYQRICSSTINNIITGRILNGLQNRKKGRV